jgi:branched-chain amino acid transport system substrate-binding protein
MTRSTTLFRTFALVCTVFSLLLLAGCESGGGYKMWESGASAPAGAPPDDTAIAPQISKVPAELPAVKVALLVPLSGKNASLGQSMLNAAQMALFDVGYTNFELLPRDTKGTAEGAATAAAEAVQNGAQLVLGPIFAEEVRAAKPAIQGAGLNMIAFSTSWDLADQSTFVMGFLPFDQIERIVTYAAAQNINRIGLIVPASDYGRTVIPAYQTMASRSGITTAQALTVPSDPAAATVAVRQFAQGLQADAIFMPLGGNAAASISGTLTQSGLSQQQVRRLGTGLFDDPMLATRPEMDGSWFAAPAPTMRANFQNRFLQTYNYPAPRLATLAYDATALAASLAQRGFESGNAPAFDRASITNPNGFAGLDGIFRFRQNSLAERGLAVLEYKHGQISVLDPAPKTFQ